MSVSATEVTFELDVTSIPRVNGWDEQGNKRPHVTVKVSANALDSAYVEVQLPVINGVAYHYGRAWAVLTTGTWQADERARPRLSSPWGRILDEPTQSAERTFVKIVELALAQLAGLDGLPAALQAAAVQSAQHAQAAALRDLAELEKKAAQARAQAQLAEDKIGRAHV